MMSFHELYHRLLSYDGADAYEDILEDWPEQNAFEVEYLEGFQRRTNQHWAKATPEDLWHLYAAFRVTSVLLLRFQDGRADGADYAGPAISVEGFQIFHEQLGFTVSSMGDYHPFFHEILSVRQSPDKEAPVAVHETRWPCLMLGNMLFCRAGCAVTAGASHAVREIAESSKLYWTFRRKDRRHHDLSHGWGHNSQWRTAHRRDYRSMDGYHFNVDGPISLNTAHADQDGLALPVMIEIVRNPCVVKTRIDDSDLWPYDYSFTEML
jgi:hypothetical protein